MHRVSQESAAPQSVSVEAPEGFGGRARVFAGAEAGGARRGRFEVLELPPGAALPVHRHPHAEQVVFVLEGRVTYESSARPVSLEAWQVAYAAPNEWHGLRNDGTEVARVAVILGGAADGETAGFEAYDPGSSTASENAPRVLAAPGAIPTTEEGGLPRESGLRRAGNYWYVSADTVGARHLLVSITRFEPGSGHFGLHVHHHAEEFFYILQGGGTHVTRGARTPLGPGEMAFTALGEEHGWENGGDAPTLVLFGWYGAASPQASGYEQTVKVDG